MHRITSELQRPTQDDHYEFEASMGYVSKKCTMANQTAHLCKLDYVSLIREENRKN